MASDHEQRLRQLLGNVWLESRPIIDERIAMIEDAVRALRSSRFGAEKRERVIEAAHKLAGALGMFGHAEASEWARQIETEFGGTADKSRLKELSERLRRWFLEME